METFSEPEGLPPGRPGEWAPLRGLFAWPFVRRRRTTTSAPDAAWRAPAVDVRLMTTIRVLLALHLRRSSEGITVAATVRFTTAQPLLTPPAIILNRYTGRQWWALSALLPGADRINGTPARPLTDELDAAIAVGSSGVMLGKVDDAFMLMPLRDPAGPTRIVIDSDDDLAVRQLIRRASASGEFVAVYDTRRRWAMAAASSRIWTTTDLRAQPPRPPTLVVHNGSSNPYPGALVSISVGAGPRSVEPDIRITQRDGRIRIETERFTARLDAVTFRNEQTFLNCRLSVLKQNVVVSISMSSRCHI